MSILDLRRKDKNRDERKRGTEREREREREASSPRADRLLIPTYPIPACCIYKHQQIDGQIDGQMDGQMDGQAGREQVPLSFSFSHFQSIYLPNSYHYLPAYLPNYLLTYLHTTHTYIHTHNI